MVPSVATFSSACGRRKCSCGIEISSAETTSIIAGKEINIAAGFQSMLRTAIPYSRWCWLPYHFSQQLCSTIVYAQHPMAPVGPDRVSGEAFPDTLILAATLPPCFPSAQPSVHVPQCGSFALSVRVQLLALLCLVTYATPKIQRKTCLLFSRVC